MKHFYENIFPKEEELSIKKMRNDLAKEFHPDKNGDNKKMVDLNLAYEVAEKGNLKPLKDLYKKRFSDNKKKKVDIYV